MDIYPFNFFHCEKIQFSLSVSFIITLHQTKFVYIIPKVFKEFTINRFATTYSRSALQSTLTGSKENRVNLILRNEEFAKIVAFLT